MGYVEGGGLGKGGCGIVEPIKPDWKVDKKGLGNMQGYEPLKLWALNPKPLTLNLEPWTLNPFLVADAADADFGLCSLFFFDMFPDGGGIGSKHGGDGGGGEGGGSRRGGKKKWTSEKQRLYAYESLNPQP